jgi:hypothetical protein
VRSAQVADTLGTLIEIVQDPKKLGLHHITLATSDPTATLTWVRRDVRRQGREGAWHDRWESTTAGVALCHQGSGDPAPGTRNRSHRLPSANVDSAVAAMKAKNVKVTTEPRPLTLPSGNGHAPGVSSRAPAACGSSWCSATT